MPVNFYLKHKKVFFSHDFTLIASVVGESVIGHGNKIRYSYELILRLRPDAGVSDDRLVCHHPISQPIKLMMAWKIHLRRRYVLNGIPYIGYPRPQTNEVSYEILRYHRVHSRT